MKKDILTLQRDNQRNDITNRLFANRQGITGNDVTVYEDIPSQSQYGIVEEWIDKFAEINNQDDLDSFGNTYIEQNKNPKQQLSFVLSPDVDFNQVKPGNIVRIKNVDFTLTDAKVVRVRFGSSKTTVDCEKSINIGDAIVNA